MQMSLIETDSLEQRMRDFWRDNGGSKPVRVPFDEFRPLVTYLRDFDAAPDYWNMDSKLSECSTVFIESIKAEGILNPITVDDHTYGGFAICEGHHRFALAADLDLDMIPVIFDSYKYTNDLPGSYEGYEGSYDQTLFDMRRDWDAEGEDASWKYLYTV